jgi:hypothetical protein
MTEGTEACQGKRREERSKKTRPTDNNVKHAMGTGGSEGAHSRPQKRRARMQHRITTHTASRRRR